MIYYLVRGHIWKHTMTKSLLLYKKDFELVSKLSLITYRKKIWHITERTINPYFENSFFNALDQQIKDRLLSLKDDDYIVPIDDDDWASPNLNIKKADFITWDTYKLHISEKAIYSKTYSETPKDFFTGVNYPVENVLSCCYAISGRLLKAANTVGLMEKILLRHNTVKQNIVKLNQLTGSLFSEHHINNKLSVAVRHIGSNTSSKRKIGPEFYNTMRTRIENFSSAQIDIPERWMENRVLELQKVYKEML